MCDAFFNLPDFYEPLQLVNLSWPRKSAFSLENSGFPTRMRKSTSDCTGSGLVRMHACVKALPAEPEVVECACAEIKHELQSVSLNRNNKRSECVRALVITMNKNII